MPNSASWFSQHFWTTMIVTIICGLAAGILGEIVARVYILPDFTSSYGNVDLSDFSGNNSGLVISGARQVVVNQDLKVSETVNDVRPLLVGVFKSLPAGGASAKTEYYDLNAPLFTGLAITADGWVAAPVPAALADNFKFKNYVAIASDRRLYQIDKLATTTAPAGNILIMHLTGAASWPVKKIMSRSDFTLGETMLAIPNSAMVWPSALTAWSQTAAVLSSESASARLSLSGGESGAFKDSFVFDLAGDLAALVTDSGDIVPAFSYAPSWSTLSQPDAPGLPFLGVNYVDLSAVKTATTTADMGAWLYAAGSQPAVKKGSPAEAAGLKAGDIITWVNNQQIDATHDLADLLAAYHAGDAITLTYRRGGAEQEVNVKLGVVK